MKRSAIVACVLLILACPFREGGEARGQDIPLTRILAPGEGWKPLGKKDFFAIGGLATDAKGLVYVSDPALKQIVRVDLDGKTEVFATLSALVDGLAFDKEGRLYGCQPRKGRIVRIESPDKEIPVAEGLKEVQGLVVTKAGTIYCTVPGERAVYFVSGENKRKLTLEQAGLLRSLVLWPDQGTLVVSDVVGSALWAFRIQKDGTLVDGEPYYPLRMRASEPSGADAMTIDAGGLVYATSGEGLQIFDPTGRLCGVCTRPSRRAQVAVTFAGPERDRLVLACGGKLYVRKMLTKGVK